MKIKREARGFFRLSTPQYKKTATKEPQKQNINVLNLVRTLRDCLQEKQDLIKNGTGRFSSRL